MYDSVHKIVGGYHARQKAAAKRRTDDSLTGKTFVYVMCSFSGGAQWFQIDFLPKKLSR